MTRGLSWSAGQAITVEPDAGAARTCTITGATTGNGSPTIAAGTIFDTAGNLAVGRDYGSSAYPFAGTISNIDDTITAATGAATLTVPAALATTGTLTRSRTAALTIGAALGTTGALTRNRAASLAVAAALATTAVATRERAAALTIPAAISTGAVRGVAASATLTVPAAIATTATKSSGASGAASLTIGAALATDAVRIPTVAGAASLTIAAQLTTTGALTRNRSVAATLAAQLTTTGTITRRRGATLVITAAIYTNLDNLTAGGGAAADRGVLEAIVADFVDPVADEVDAPPADPDTV